MRGRTCLCRRRIAADFAHWRIIRARRSRRGVSVPIGTAVHERTFPLCQSLNYREWSGFYAVSVYETHHEHEYNAIRNAAALIDVTPALQVHDQRAAMRPASSTVSSRVTSTRSRVDQVIYCCWCDEEGKIIDDGTITRLEENRYRWTAADPNLRWFRQNARSVLKCRSKTSPSRLRRWLCRDRRRANC